MSIPFCVDQDAARFVCLNQGIDTPYRPLDRAFASFLVGTSRSRTVGSAWRFGPRNRKGD